MQVSNVKGGSRQSKRQEIRRKAHYDLDTLSSSGMHGSQNFLTIATNVPDSIKVLFGAICSNKTCVFGVVHLNRLTVEYSSGSKLESLGLVLVDRSGRVVVNESSSSLLLDMLFPVASLCFEEYPSVASAIKFDDSDCISLLSLAVLLRRDVIVSALLRACVSPFTFNVTLRDTTVSCRSLELASIDIHAVVSSYRNSTTLTAFIWLLYQIALLKCRTVDDVCCTLCGQRCYQADNFVSLKRCHHLVCLTCLWTNIRSFTGDIRCDLSDSKDYSAFDVNSLLKDSLYCPVCKVSVDPSVVGGVSFQLVDDAQKNKQTSLEKWLLLPESLLGDVDSENNNSSSDNSKIGDKLKFQALSPSQSAYYSLGSSQTQRTSQLFKCVMENNPRRLLALIDRGVCLDLVNHYHMSALCVAVMLGHTEVVIVLLRAGADVFLNNAARGSSESRNCSDVKSTDCYLLDIAKHFKHEQVVTVLEQYLQLHFGGLISVCPPSVVTHCLYVTEFTNIHWLVPTKTTISCLKGNKETLKPHPGAGKSFIIDSIFTAQFVDDIVHVFTGLPVAQKVKETCSDRTYYCDILGQFTTAIEQAVRLMLQKSSETGDANAGADFCSSRSVEVFPSMKLLNYTDVGGTSCPHIDLNKSSILTERHSNYTFILYTSDCDLGGQTVLLRSVKESWAISTHEPIPENVLACVAPRRGRLLVFPHCCPHAGLATDDTPKMLLRGEILIE